MSEEETAEEQAGDAAASPDDILNSPAFLQRKLEVLESDIATAEEDLAAATERKEVAKEEWGPQLEALEREVRFYWSWPKLQEFTGLDRSVNQGGSDWIAQY